MLEPTSYRNRPPAAQAPGQPPDALSVSELTGNLKAVIEQTFPALWVAGEISDLARPRSGHLYFTLKDQHAQIRGVMWRSTAARLKFDLEDGQEVLCMGDVEVYAARGSYQLIVRKIQPQGVGGLQLAFQQLQAKLHAEGLFDAGRKRPLPPYPARIGIVTSATGAAVRDFLEAASHRYTGAEIIIIPARVQGKGAAQSIVMGIAAAHQMRPPLDVLVVSRGGGSLEDLWCFNEEIVVRAVANSSIPVVSAVGHEIDVTLCDLAADVRALTPTDGATRALPDGQMIAHAADSLRLRLDRAMRNGLRQRAMRLESLSQRPILRNPQELVHLRSRLLDEIDARALRAIRDLVNRGKARLQQSAASLSALSPLNVLSRGYSVTLGADGKPVSDVTRLEPGEQIRTRVHRGEIVSEVVSFDEVEPESAFTPSQVGT